MRYLITFFLMIVPVLFFGQTIEGNLIKIKAKPNKGFNYGYLLFLPKGIENDRTHYLLVEPVEPNNSGFLDDSIEEHEKHARHLAGVNSIGNYVATKLKVLLLVPIFPRPMNDQNTYTHALDSDAMLIDNGEYKRLDLQLLAIVDDAKQELKKKGIKTRTKVFMNGFSASGSFVNRFSLLHPETIAALAIGGFNGILMMPLKSLGGETLNYPLGINDFEEITNSKFDKDAFKKITQFIYLGDKDSNDAVKYDDAYNPEERRIIYKVLGKKMQPDRWLKC